MDHQVVESTHMMGLELLWQVSLSHVRQRSGGTQPADVDYYPATIHQE